MADDDSVEEAPPRKWPRWLALFWYGPLTFLALLTLYTFSAHASFLFHRGAPVAAIQTQLGHTSPLTTVRYLASIGAHDAHRHVAAAFAATA